MKYALLSFLFLCSIKFAEAYIYQEKDSINYYSQLVNKPTSDSSLTKAYNYFNKKRLESINSKDTSSLISNLRQIAIIQNKLGDYFGSESSVVEALELLDKFKLSKRTIQDKIGLLNQLGRIYMELLDYDASIRYFDEALQIAETKGYVNIIQNNKALVYVEQGNYERAEKVFSEVYANSVLLEDKEQTARALDNLGFVQSKLNRTDALNNLEAALELRLVNQDNAGTYSSYKHLMTYYKDRNDMVSANNYANKAYNMAKLINSPSFILDAVSHLIKLGNETNVIEYMKITDSISKTKLLQENKYAKIKYDYTEKEKLAKQIELEKEKEKNLKLIYLGLGILIALILISMLFILSVKHKKDKLKVVYDTETRISKRVHDEVANDVYHAMTKLQNKSENKEDLLDDLENIYNRTRDISRGISAIDVKTNFPDLLNDLLFSYKSTAISIITKNLSAIDWKGTDDIKRATVYRVLQELMTNMLKHSQATIVLISFSQNKSKIVIDYKDNGIGCNLIKNNGLLNTENRMEAINGSITFDSQVNNSFKATIII